MKDINKLRLIDLFAGIGGIRLGFEQGAKAFFAQEKPAIECVFSSELDKFAQMTYQANFQHRPQGDITKIHEADIEAFDILCAGFPCQPFSNAGHKMGFEDTRGTLFFDIARIINHHKPKVVFLENVKGLRGHNKGKTFQVIAKTLENMGYAIHANILNAKDFGVPQNRERLYIVGFLGDLDFNFPEKTNSQHSPQMVGNILQDIVDDKYTLSDKLWAGHQRRKLEHIEKGNGFGYSLFDSNSAYTSTISARYYKDGSEILIAQPHKNPRKITPREAARLQGFPEEFEIPVSDVQAYKQFGNSVCVPVIKALAISIFQALELAVLRKKQHNPPP